MGAIKATCSNINLSERSSSSLLLFFERDLLSILWGFCFTVIFQIQKKWQQQLANLKSLTFLFHLVKIGSNVMLRWLPSYKKILILMWHCCGHISYVEFRWQKCLVLANLDRYKICSTWKIPSRRRLIFLDGNTEQNVGR